jgi:hypothetical protein
MDSIGAKIENLTIGEINEILAIMEANLAAEENAANMHEFDEDKDAKEESIWKCVVYKGYIDLLKKAKAILVVKGEFDSIWEEQDEGKQIVKACKLIITIASCGEGTSYLCLIGPLLKPSRQVEKLTKKETSFVQKELLALVDPAIDAPDINK